MDLRRLLKRLQEEVDKDPIMSSVEARRRTCKWQSAVKVRAIPSITSSEAASL